MLIGGNVLDDLISVVIITYNAKKTVERTLKSVYIQTYANIELIVSDDCSSDGTIEVVQKWIEENEAEKRFKRIIVHKNEKNVGISQNCNRGCKLARGKWVKLIAGDDILLATCIESNVDFVNKIKENALIFSDVIPFWEKNGVINLEKIDLKGIRSYRKLFNRKRAQQQHKVLLKRYDLPAPTYFFPKDEWKLMGGFDEKYKNVEDWPFVLHWTENGLPIRYLEKETVLYRSIDENVNKEIVFYNVSHLAIVNSIKKDLVYPDIPKWHLVYYYNEWVTKKIQQFMIKKFDNKMTKQSLWVHYCLTWLPPYNIKRKISKLMRMGFCGVWKSGKNNYDRVQLSTRLKDK